MQAVRGTKPTNLLHTTPVRGSALLAAICLFILFHPICVAGATPTTADAMLAKAQALIDKAAAKATGVSAVPLYDEPIKLLGEITARHPDAKEASIQAEKLKALCYDRQARYAEKHQALKRYADLASRGDKEMAAGILKAAADALFEAKEMTEAVMLCRLVGREYADTGVAPGALFRVATDMWEKEYEVDKGVLDRPEKYPAAREYVGLIQKYPHSRFSADACVAVAEAYKDQKDQRDKVVSLLWGFLRENAESQYTEEVFNSLYQLLNRKEDRAERAKIAKTYLERYPQGKYSVEFQEKLRALAKVTQAE